MVDNTQMELEESGSGNPALSPLSILRAVWKRKIRIALTWVLFTLVGAAVVRMLPSVYLSEAVILIDTQKIPEKFVSATVATDLEDRIAAIRETLLSGGELKKIIDDFGLYREARKTHFEEEVLEMMRKDTSITLEPVGTGSSSSDKRTASFRIGYQGPDPVLVMRVANRLTDLYVDQNLKTREVQAEGTSEFLDNQLNEAKKRLDELEAAVSAYKLQHNGELPQQEQTMASALSRLQTELEANRDAINRTQQTKIIQESTISATEANAAAQTLALLYGRGAVAQAGTPGAQAPTTLPRKASEVLQERLEQLLARYTENHPQVISLRSAIAAAKRAEEKEESQIKVLDDELANRTAEQQRILRETEQYQRRMQRLPQREQEMAQITRDYEIAKENYKSLLDKKTAAGMALDMERRQQSERFTILDRAQLPEKPIKPKRPLLYAAAFAVGLALALVFGVSSELRRNVILGEWELPPGTLVLARLPYIEVRAATGQAKAPSRGRWFQRRKGVAKACAT